MDTHEEYRSKAKENYNNLNNQLEEKQKKDSWIYAILAGVIVIAITVMVGNLILYVGFNKDKYLETVKVSVIISIFSIIGIFIKIKLCKNESEKVFPLKFFLTCANKDIFDLSNRSQYERALLIGKELKVTDNDVVKLYNNGKEQFETENINEQKLKINKKKESERYWKQRCERFADYTGREKRIEMLAELWNKEQKHANKCREDSHKLFQSSQMSEKDWASRGGFAAGLAGGAAGLATALNVQAQNREIRAQNEANLDAIMPTILSMTSSAAYSEDKAQKLREEIINTQYKLVAETPKEKLFKQLIFENEKLDVSETGAVSVSVEVSAKNKLKINNEIPAVIDGTITATLIDGDTVIGEMYLVLPTYGIQKETVLHGMFIRDIQPLHQYRLEYKPYSLWLIEE